MTKAEELKLLDKIDGLIKSAGEDSYIAMTFKGVVEIARSNIENDFGDTPVEDLAAARKKADMLDGIARQRKGEYDALKEDFDKLSEAYRYAVQTMQTAQYYIHIERVRLCNAVDALPEDASDEEITSTVRQHKQAQTAARRCAEVLDASRRQPLCYSMQE